MELILTVLAALLLLTLAAYAQLQIPRFTKRSGGRVFMTRALLIVVGIGFGLVGAAQYDVSLWKWLAFLVGFGLVHLPAAVILFIKRERGTGKS